MTELTHHDGVGLVGPGVLAGRRRTPTPAPRPPTGSLPHRDAAGLLRCDRSGPWCDCPPVFDGRTLRSAHDPALFREDDR